MADFKEHSRAALKKDIAGCKHALVQLEAALAALDGYEDRQEPRARPIVSGLGLSVEREAMLIAAADIIGTGKVRIAKLLNLLVQRGHRPTDRELKKFLAAAPERFTVNSKGWWSLTRQPKPEHGGPHAV